MQDPNHQMSLYIIQQPIEPYVGMMFAAEKSRFCANFSFIHFFLLNVAYLDLKVVRLEFVARREPRVLKAAPSWTESWFVDSHL